MGDVKLDATQVINGLAVLLSFFVGYKYALKKHDISDEKKELGRGDGNQRLATPRGNFKMVLLVRNDLKMGKGKVAAQCGHGAVGAYQKAVRNIPHVVRAWENNGCAKIALRVESEQELMSLKGAADSHNLNTCLIRDAGRTQIEPNSKTVLAIGPARDVDIDQITGHLKLL